MSRIPVAAALAAVLLGLAAAQTEAPQQPAPHPDLQRVEQLLENGDDTGARAAVVAMIEATPDAFAAHDLFLRVARGKGRPNPEQVAERKKATEAQYGTWRQRFPRSAGVAYGLGSFYSAGEDPRAREFLLQVVELDPKQAKVWQMLSIDAERWGERETARDFMHKAVEAEPQNADYAFYWANSWHGVDDATWERESVDVARRFPASERGAQALYWLGERSRDDAQKVRFWEQARRDFPPAKFQWTRSSMGQLFDAYLRTDPAKAVELAAAMPQQGDGRGDDWPQQLALAQRVVEVQQRIAAGDHAAALAPAKALVAQRYSSCAEMIDLLKADVLAGAGQLQDAYGALAKRLAEKPEDRTRAALLRYGEQLGKTAAAVDADVWAERDQLARPAPDFDLQRYGSDATISLRSLRGKVVFVTFWFPGCGPCRGEFPYFEHVVRTFADNPDLVYLGINGLTEQDGYVESFMRGTRYSFTPLRADDTVCKPAAYNVRGYPENLLIDRDGRIVYRHFRIDNNNELLLQRMIESLLARPQQGAAPGAPK